MAHTCTTDHTGHPGAEMKRENDTSNWAAAVSAVAESIQNRDPADVIRDLCNLAHAMGEEAADALLDANPALYRHVPALTHTFHERVVRKEIAESERLLRQTWAGPVSFVDVAGPAVLHTYNRVREMFDRVDFRACRCFVMVGCGRLPVTMFHVHDRAETPEIVGLDIVPDAIETAGRIAARFGYGRIRAVLCDGQAYDYAQAQIVFITNMIASKAAVLSRIADTAPPDVRVIVRDPYSLRRLWSEDGERSLDPRLEIIGRGTAHPTLSRDVYLKRRAVGDAADAGDRTREEQSAKY